MIKETMHN